MAKSRTVRDPRLRPPAAHADWAFHADDEAVLRALAAGRRVPCLREYFGTPAHEELSQLAVRAHKSAKPRGARVWILPGIMGSKLGSAAGRGVLWIDPLQISAGRLTALALPGERAITLGSLRDKFEGWLPGYMAGEPPAAA